MRIVTLPLNASSSHTKFSTSGYRHSESTIRSHLGYVDLLNELKIL